ncbi:hypothetical protein QIX46_07625 [Lysinibacillus boronitolerans]|nr:hypothetical protein QIX46_07625 [Lysinibacillus boronitolerans]
MLDFTNYYDDDLEEILQLFYETVHNVNAQDNSQTQLDAWAPLAIQPVNVAAWQKTLRNNKTVIRPMSQGRIIKLLALGI